MSVILFMQYATLALKLVQEGKLTVDAFKVFLKQNGATDAELLAVQNEYLSRLAARP